MQRLVDRKRREARDFVLERLLPTNTANDGFFFGMAAMASQQTGQLSQQAGKAGY